jgi:hypothetical protein
MYFRPGIAEAAWQPLRDRWNMLLVHSFEAYIEIRPATAEEVSERISMELQCADGRVETNPHAWARWEQHFVVNASNDNPVAVDMPYWCQPPTAWQPPMAAAHTCQLRWTYLKEALERYDASESEDSKVDYGPVRLALDFRLEAQHMSWEAQLVRCQLDSGDAEVEWQGQAHSRLYGPQMPIGGVVHGLCRQATWRQNVISGVGKTAWSTVEGTCQHHRSRPPPAARPMTWSLPCRCGVCPWI